MLAIAQIVVSVILIALVLIQERSMGLSSVFGGSESTPYHTRRGLEKFVFWATVVFAVIFAVLAVLNLVSTP
jgi:preprotein translocase subunit SecG